MTGNQFLKLSDANFYLLEMRRAIEAFNTGKPHDIGFPIFSFFCGRRTSETAVEVNTGHLSIIFDRKMQFALDRNPALFIRWVEVIYFYFLQMAAVPSLAGEIWTPLWLALNMFEKGGEETLQARMQMGSWAAFYDKEKANKALMHIKEMKTTTVQQEVNRALFLSTEINRGNADYLANIKFAYEHSSLLRPISRLQANVHYYSQISSSRELLYDIISILNWSELSYYRDGKMGLLSPIFWTLFRENNYDDLLFFCRCLKGNIDPASLNVGHAFLMPVSGASFPALTKSELITFEDRDNGQSYFSLMRICNRLTNTAISLLGEQDLDHVVESDERLGTPNLDGDFEELRKATVDHYHLDDDLYKEIELMSLIPSHNHPLQGALLMAGIKPPLISISLSDLAEEPAVKKFVFFLSSDTFTHDLEQSWIRSEFGSDAEVFTDPTTELLTQYLSDEQYTHVYISAHGIYSHRQSGGQAIHFSPTATVPVAALEAINRRNSATARLVLLNICDGGASPLSFNHNSSGLAAALVARGLTVISHLWPIKPLYACIFGTIIIKLLRTESTANALVDGYSILNRTNSEAAELVKKLGASFSNIGDALSKATFDVADFRNLGSTVIYV